MAFLGLILLKTRHSYREIIPNLMFYIRFVLYRIVLIIYVVFLLAWFFHVHLLFADFSCFFP